MVFRGRRRRHRVFRVARGEADHRRIGGLLVVRRALPPDERVHLLTYAARLPLADDTLRLG